MISFQNINFAYYEQKILDDITAQIEQGSLTALIGPNGAGKSTLLNVLARLLRPQSGSIYYDEHNLLTADDKTLAKVLAVMSQDSRIDSRITVKELLIFGRYPYHAGRPKKQDIDVVNAMLARFMLGEFKNRYLDELSGGQRQRAFIAMVFCQSTDYILLDEPLNNLDMYHENMLMQTIRQAVTELGRTIVLVLHDINQAIAYADNIIALNNGKIVFTGAPPEVITSANIYRLFNVKTDIIDYQGRKIVVANL